jgi:hypothetical protein
VLVTAVDHAQASSGFSIVCILACRFSIAMLPFYRGLISPLSCCRKPVYNDLFMRINGMLHFILFNRFLNIKYFHMYAYFMVVEVMSRYLS